MIEILEIKDAEKRKAILRENGIAEDHSTVLQMTDRGEVLGSCFLCIEKDTLMILKLNAGLWQITEKPDTEQSFILDSLVRSAASFAEIKGVLHMKTAFSDFHDFFKRMGFQTDDDHAYGTIDVIVQYHA